MTTSTLSTDLATSIVAELGGSSPTNVEMMIGVGLVKDSDAVFFQYLGEEQTPTALVMPSGKPCTRMANVRLVGVTVADDIGEFNSTKLNLFLETSAGRQLMLTSGLQTIWSQCVITSLMGLFNSYSVAEPFVLDTWKGTSKMRPCFAAIRSGQLKQTSQTMYDALLEARGDRDYAKTEAICRDAVAVLAQAVGYEAPVPTDIKVEQENEF